MFIYRFVFFILNGSLLGLFGILFIIIEILEDIDKIWDYFERICVLFKVL